MLLRLHPEITPWSARPLCGSRSPPRGCPSSSCAATRTAVNLAAAGGSRWLRAASSRSETARASLAPPRRSARAYETVKSKSVSSQVGTGGRNEWESEQRRALLLHQELKEIGKWKEVVCENCKPILCDKIR